MHDITWCFLCEVLLTVGGNWITFLAFAYNPLLDYWKLSSASCWLRSMIENEFLEYTHIDWRKYYRCSSIIGNCNSSAELCIKMIMQCSSTASEFEWTNENMLLYNRSCESDRAPLSLPSHRTKWCLSARMDYLLCTHRLACVWKWKRNKKTNQKQLTVIRLFDALTIAVRVRVFHTFGVSFTQFLMRSICHWTLPFWLWHRFVRLTRDKRT